MKIAVCFDNFGPYHLARLRAAASVCDLLAVQVAVDSAEYAWKNESGEEDLLMDESIDSSQFEIPQRTWKLVTLQTIGSSEKTSSEKLRRRWSEKLDWFKPQVVFIPGWSSPIAMIALDWCAKHRVPSVMMSESTEWDEPRKNWKEWVKRQIIGFCSSALVGGSAHLDYLVKLGVPKDHIFTGYDVVDNRYFNETEAERANLVAPGPYEQGVSAQKYFLASARFIEKKNLPRLLEAYARYRTLVEQHNNPKIKSNDHKSEVWDLILLGDGSLRETLKAQLSRLNLHGPVQLPGFKQYHDLPAYYRGAKVFIHASTTEQWGLVVNEAMASGLPVLVSNRCGCASDLVRDGENGFTFDPFNIEQLAELMIRISAPDFPISDFGNASRQRISKWGPDCFGQGLKAASECAVRVGPKRGSLLQKIVLKAMLWK